MEFYSCHMNLPTCETEKMDKSIQIILNRNEDDIIKVLMGDFNTNMLKDKEDYENILNQGLLDTYQLAEKKDDGITVGGDIDGWQGQKEKKKLDYIFLTKELKVKESKVIFNGKNYPVISDHYGIEVILDVE